MQTLSATYNGPISLREDTNLSGIVTGNAIVPSGIYLDCRGIVTGNVVVEKDGSADIYGIVNGTVVNKGGQVRVYGIVGAINDTGGAATFVDQKAIVTKA